MIFWPGEIPDIINVLFIIGLVIGIICAVVYFQVLERYPLLKNVWHAVRNIAGFAMIAGIALEFYRFIASMF